MRVEIRASGGPACDQCGATELVHSRGNPAVRDVTREFEREILRREIAVMRMLRDHLDATDANHAAVARAHRAELFALTQTHHEEVAAVRDRLEAAKVDVAKWRVVRRHREKVFAERIDAVVGELLDSTRHGSR